MPRPRIARIARADIGKDVLVGDGEAVAGQFGEAALCAALRATR